MRPVDFDVVLIAGPQGSGKGTQGKLLAKKLDFLFWDTGSILREMSRENNALAQQLAVINKGTLLSDEMIINVLKERLGELPDNKGVVFDGVPRRTGQAEFLLDFFKAKHKRIVTVFIDLSREECYKRLLGRAAKENRLDDNHEAIETRLKFYENDIRPAIEYLKKHTRFVQVDGTPSVEVVEKSIDAALGLA